MSSPAAVSCTACGEANPGHARFCLSCGTALVPAGQRREVRKTVTTLFCDVVESTSLGERTDAELVRRVMSRFFDEMRAVIERHGGTVEKFAGDEIMAVFGVPTVHEDDAVRAVRAAAEMRSQLRRLNAELDRTFGVTLVTRVGVNTGEVVAGDPAGGQTFVTGESVNLAKRLQQAAGPGEILIGTATYPLVKDAVEAGPAQRFSVKGKAEPVAPRRLDAVDATAPGLARRFDAPLQGRHSELESLQQAFDDAVRERSARLVTLLGPAGIGKSRLAREFLAAVSERADTLTGRCLPYGEGITFWPLSQIVREAGGEQGLEEAVACEAEAGLITERIRGAIGLSPAEGGTHETFWAVRRFFECLASRRPLVVCFEDIHWAEPTLLDLIEYLTSSSRRAPVLIICLARPDLLDTRSTWATPTADSTLVLLEPLSTDHIEALLEWLQGDAKLGPDSRARIMQAADGNPLFVEQMAAMATGEEDGTGPLRVPPSIQALLEERLDRLDPDERLVIEHAAVIGKEFWRGALLELLPALDQATAESQLRSLVRKGLVQPDVSPGREEAFRFRHALIRDAAYDRLPKDLRAALHERFADWIERNAAGNASEFEEIRGYHLEQAVRYREQLGPVDERTRVLAARAGELLGAAGQRAFARDDIPAAIKLLDRAVALLTDQHPARLELLRELSGGFWAVGELARAESLLSGVLEAAAAADDRRIEWFALLEREGRRHMTEADASADELHEVSQNAIHVFEELGDNAGLARAWRSLSWVPRGRGQFAIAEDAIERALHYARRAGDAREEARSVDVLCTTLLYGPAPADAAARRCEDLMKQAAGNRLMEANVATSLAGLEAMRGEVDEARALGSRAEGIYKDLGLKLPLVAWTEIAGFVELLAGEPAAAETVLRRGYELLSGAATSSLSAFQAGLLAVPVLAQGRYNEAERLARISEEAGTADKFEGQVQWGQTRALLQAERGQIDEACATARKAVDLAAETDALNMHADALMTLGEVLRLAGREEDALGAIRESLALYEQKGNVVSAQKAASLLAAPIG